MGRTKTVAPSPDEEPQGRGVSALIAASVKPHLDLLALRQHGQHLTQDEDNAIIAILAAMDGNIGRTASLTGLTTSCVWNVKERNKAALLEERERFKSQFVTKLQDISNAMVDRIAIKVNTEDYSLRDGMVSLGIAIDKAAMLAGEGSTINVNHTHKVDTASVALVADRLREIMGGRPTGEVLEAEFTLVEEDA
jgi:hypothetical protein